MQTRAAVRGLRKNGDEFPIEVTISKIKVAESTEMTAVIRDVSEKNNLMEELIMTSRKDHLTNLNNRRYFTELLEKEILRFKRFKRGFSLLMIDLDRFKVINDTYGHEFGDIVLKSFATIMADSLRETDVTGRWGGEEFLILLPETDETTAYKVAENIRKTVEESEVEYDGEIIKFTISIGIKYFENNELEINELLNQVDKKLYQAKSEGRNKVSK